jgi:hypothetical protein
MHSCWCFVFLSKFDENWSCSVELCNEFMFKCCCCYLDICCCWIDAMGIIEMVNWGWICCCCWKLWKIDELVNFDEIKWNCSVDDFNEWNKLIMMSYGIMISCFWLLFGNEEWFGRELGFWEKQILSVLGNKWLWDKLFWRLWKYNFSEKYDRINWVERIGENGIEFGLTVEILRTKWRNRKTGTAQNRSSAHWLLPICAWAQEAMPGRGLAAPHGCLPCCVVLGCFGANSGLPKLILSMFSLFSRLSKPMETSKELSWTWLLGFNQAFCWLFKECSRTLIFWKLVFSKEWSRVKYVWCLYDF